MYIIPVSQTIFFLSLEFNEQKCAKIDLWSLISDLSLLSGAHARHGDVHAADHLRAAESKLEPAKLLIV